MWLLPSAPSDAAAAGDAEDSPDAAQRATMLRAMSTPFGARRDHVREDHADRGDHGRADRAAAGRNAGRLNMLSSSARAWQNLSKGCGRFPGTSIIVCTRPESSLYPLTETCQDLRERRTWAAVSKPPKTSRRPAQRAVSSSRIRSGGTVPRRAAPLEDPETDACFQFRGGMDRIARTHPHRTR